MHRRDPVVHKSRKARNKAKKKEMEEAKKWQYDLRSAPGCSQQRGLKRKTSGEHEEWKQIYHHSKDEAQDVSLPSEELITKIRKKEEGKQGEEEARQEVDVARRQSQAGNRIFLLPEARMKGKRVEGIEGRGIQFSDIESKSNQHAEEKVGEVQKNGKGRTSWHHPQHLGTSRK